MIAFKYALAYLLRGARHALHDILLLRTSAIRRRLYLGRRLDSHQDEFVLLATYRGGSLISFQDQAESGIRTTPNSQRCLNALAIDHPLEYARLALDGELQAWVDAEDGLEVF